ncbi:MAG: hypothetical protein AAFN78_16510 [Pseudomonadota bacterium]
MIRNTHRASCARHLFTFVTCLVLALSAAGAHAAPVRWVLQDVLFDDGGTAFGSFLYDADTNTLSSINVTTTDGAVLAGSFYEFANFEAGILDADSVLLVAQENPTTGTPAFNLNLDAAMTNAGGTIAIAMAPPPLAFESTCLISNCSQFFSLDRVVVSGFITTIPVPGAVWLLGSALGFLGWRGGRRFSA